MSQFMEIINSKFPGKAILGRKEVCNILGISEASFNRYIKANELYRLPKYQRFGSGPKPRFMFTVKNVIDFLEGMK